MRRALEDKVIVIIGGTSGIGLSAARACLREGARVVAVGLGADGPAPEDTEALRVRVGDARDPATAPAALDAALGAFGGFDALYHVAGGSGRKMGDGPLHTLTDDGIAQTLDLNLVSLIYSNRAAVQSFLARSVPGAVLNLGSVLATSPSPKHFASHAYAAAKSAITGFTQSCAAYYAPHNIRFNVLAPGLTDTPMAKRAMDDEAIMAFVRAKQPLGGGRAAQPEDLDGAAVFLLSDAASFVTGQVLAADGGWSVSEGTA